MKGLLTFVLLTITYFSLSQVELRDTLIFSNSNDSLRVIEGLADPINSNDAMSAKSLISGQTRMATITGGSNNNIEASMTPSLSSYSAGMSLMFFANSVNSDSVLINIDGLGFIPIVKAGGYQLDSAELKNNLLVNLVFDGTQFVAISALNKYCPPGFIDVNDKYCIQINEQDTIPYWDAIVHCGNLNAKLCTWSEWYLACAKLGSSLNDMTNNWEFIDSAQNYDASFTPKSSPKVIGNGLCETSARSNPDLNRGFRCCYNK